MKLKTILFINSMILCVINASTPKPSAPSAAGSVAQLASAFIEASAIAVPAVQSVSTGVSDAEFKRRAEFFKNEASATPTPAQPRSAPLITAGQVFQEELETKQNEQWTQDHDDVWNALKYALVQPKQEGNLKFALKMLAWGHHNTHWQAKRSGHASLAHLADATNKYYKGKFSTSYPQQWEAIMETLNSDNSQAIKEEQQRIAAIAQRNANKQHASMATE